MEGTPGPLQRLYQGPQPGKIAWKFRQGNIRVMDLVLIRHGQVDDEKIGPLLARLQKRLDPIEGAALQTVLEQRLAEHGAKCRIVVEEYEMSHAASLLTSSSPQALDEDCARTEKLQARFYKALGGTRAVCGEL